MSVVPRPDPTSRFPTSYCRICGASFPEYVRCAKWDCDMTDLSDSEIAKAKQAIQSNDGWTTVIPPQHGWTNKI